MPDYLKVWTVQRCGLFSFPSLIDLMEVNMHNRFNSSSRTPHPFILLKIDFTGNQDLIKHNKREETKRQQELD